MRSTRSCAAPSACTCCPPTTRGPAPCWPRPAPSALLGDPRFVQVLDAVEENDLVYVVHEWLPDATELTALLAAGPLEAHDAYQMVSQVSQAMAAAHREGLAHLRLNPGAVLRTSSGQYRIRGLAVNAALRGISSDTPQRTDTEAIGALLYAALTQRWPYESDAYGLSGLPKGVGLIAPDQVRAGVHRGLSELAMRALVNDGATASRQEPPCTTPEELVKASPRCPASARRSPRSPPRPSTSARRTSRAPTAATHAASGRHAARCRPRRPRCRAVPARPSSGPSPALLIAALGLGSWQLADALMDQRQVRRHRRRPSTTDGNDKGGSKTTPAQAAHHRRTRRSTYPDGEAAARRGRAELTYDGDSSTYWRTYSLQRRPRAGAVQAGRAASSTTWASAQELSAASIGLYYGGDHTTVSLYAADSTLVVGAPSATMTKIAEADRRSGTATVNDAPLTKPVKTRYVLRAGSPTVPYSAERPSTAAPATSRRSPM